MTDYEVTKQKVIEIVTRLPVEIKLTKNLETNKIVGELIINSTHFGDFDLVGSDMACLPNSTEWKKYFESRFDTFDYTDVIKKV
jgi:hypothetical protein